MKMTSSIIIVKRNNKVHRRTVVKQVSSWETPNVKYIYTDGQMDGFLGSFSRDIKEISKRYQRDIKSHVSICVNSVDVIKISGKRASSSWSWSSSSSSLFWNGALLRLRTRGHTTTTREDGRTSGGCKRPTPEDGCRRVRACVNRFESV